MYVGGQVEVSLTFTAPTGGPRPTGYDVIRTQAGGSGSGSTTTYSWGAVTSGTISVQAPPTGVRYLWSVRSRIGTQVSAASASRATVPKLVGLVAWQARDELRAQGLSARTTLKKVTNAKQLGKVVAQAVKAGTVVASSTAVGITVGSKQ
jgi:beta-lactam-binding protein with PASTA domain